MAAFTASQFGARFLFATLLVFATYNPTGYSYIHWLTGIFPDVTAPVALCGVLLGIGWAIYIRATLRSLGIVGLILAAALFGCFVWLLVDLGVLSLEKINIFSWVLLFLLSLILGIGMSWSHIRRRWSGQVDTDDVDEN